MTIERENRRGISGRLSKFGQYLLYEFSYSKCEKDQGVERSCNKALAK